MNKTFLFASALLCAGCFIASCSNDDEEIVNVQPTNKTVTIHAGISEDAATRIALGESVDGKTKVLWSAGDAFSLINGENTYTFSRAADDTEEMASADFSYTGTETLPDLSTAGLSFSYPATGVPTNYAYQTGTEEGLSNYMVMTATIPEGASWDNLHLSFKHNTAVVKITLTNEVFKDKDVIVSLNATGLLEYSTFITSDALAADGNGTVTAYFAVPATDELNDCRIIASCEDIRYKTTLGAKAITAGKLYTINKTDEQLTEMTSHLLPTGEEFNSIVLGKLGQCSCTKIKFVANSNATSTDRLFTDKNGKSSYLIANGDWLEIHTIANEFIANENCWNMFGGAGGDNDFAKITTIEFTENFNTEYVKNMNMMFWYCTSVTSIDLRSFKTFNVTDMGNMFDACKSIKSLDLSCFNTQNVTTINSMFCHCTSLESVNLKSFDTRKVTLMHVLFQGCESLKNIDISHFVTSNVTWMENMFESCYSLTSLNLSNFNTEKVTEMNSMFRDCKNLKNLDIRNFSFKQSPSVTQMLETLNTNITVVVVNESGYEYLATPTTDCGSSYAKFVKPDGTNWE